MEHNHPNHTLSISTLSVNSLTEPVGIDTNPVFGWIPCATGFARTQTAYRIIVSSTIEYAQHEKGDLWDSGKTSNDKNYDIPYAGTPLKSKHRYYWRVRLWDEKDSPTAFSPVASFSTGLLTVTDWEGYWIGAPCRPYTHDRRGLLLRKTFCLNKDIDTAYAYICGLGLFSLQINGRKPDDSVLNPAHTQYSSAALYRAFDVTSLLQKSENAIGIELGNGFFNENSGVWKWQEASWRSPCRLLFNLEIRFKDGSRKTVFSDGSWKATLDGPTLANGIYQGETFDARKQKKGYDLPGYMDSEWEAAKCIGRPGELFPYRLSCQLMPPIRPVESFSPKQIYLVGDQTWIIEAPEMLTGWARLRLQPADGEAVTILYGEQLDDRGLVRRIGRGEGECGEWWPEYYLQQDCYIGDGNEAFFEPKFSYKGFRYIQIDHYAGRLCSEDVTLYRLSNDLSQNSFHCSHETLNSMHRLMVRTMRNNFQGKPTDTPVWEKNGWLGDANVALPTMLYNFDMSNFLIAFLHTMQDCFLEYGTVPIMVPTAGWGVNNSPVWNSLFVFGARALYDYYGRLEEVRSLYPALRDFTQKDIRQIRSAGWIWPDREALADWVSPMGDPQLPIDPDPSEGAGICTTAFVYELLLSMAYLAKALEKEEDAAEYTQAAKQISAAFGEKFYRPDKDLYETGFWKDTGKRTKYRQTSNLLPLAFGLTPENLRSAVVQNLTADIEKKGCHLDTGCVGTKFLLPVLADHGHADLAWRLLMQTSYPGWRFWLAQGADSAWETWELTTRSQNHYFLGTFDEYFFSHIIGIRDVREGFRSFVLSPIFPPDLTTAQATLQTVHGPLACAWERNENHITLTLQIPFGSSAQMYLPVSDPDQVRLNADDPDAHKACLLSESDDFSRQSGRTKWLVESGNFTFVIRQ